MRDRVIDHQLLSENRDLAAEWRRLRSDIHITIERLCALGERLAVSDDAAYAIDLSRQWMLDFVDGQAFRGSTSELMSAVTRLL